MAGLGLDGTLVAAALFNPVRRWVQQAVDRRFNRARYDADQTVAAFAARLKDAVDLDSVRHDLARDPFTGTVLRQRQAGRFGRYSQITRRESRIVVPARVRLVSG